jgi:hypothetical protein
MSGLQPADEGIYRQCSEVCGRRREVIAAFFFTVPTLKFRTLYCFFVIEHSRRTILHFNCIEHPTSNRIAQQLRETLHLRCPYRYLLFERDAKFGNEVLAFLKASGVTPTRTIRAKPLAERDR